MIELLSDNPLLKYLLLVSLFAIVSVAAYFTSLAVGARQMARQRLDEGRPATGEGMALGSLRSDRVESTWLKMVDSIEKAGLSLVDTKDANVRRRLIAAGYTATYAPRVYTLLRLVLVIGLPTLLIQSTKLGSSIAQTLRIYAAEMRERRRLRAEEKAHRLPVLLSIPLVVCMLPVMIGVLMLPAAIRVIRAILPALNAGGG